jgi:hypothetical protein
MDGSGEAYGSDFTPKKRISGNIPNSSRSQRQVYALSINRRCIHSSYYLYNKIPFLLRYRMNVPNVDRGSTAKKKCNEWLCYSAALSSAATVIAPDK